MLAPEPHLGSPIVRVWCAAPTLSLCPRLSVAGAEAALLEGSDVCRLLRTGATLHARLPTTEASMLGSEVALAQARAATCFLEIVLSCAG